jgi:hypothetical protein
MSHPSRPIIPMARLPPVRAIRPLLRHRWTSHLRAVPGSSPVHAEADPSGDALMAARPVCHGRAWLTLCLGCWSDRCLLCDPYTSDGCRYREY